MKLIKVGFKNFRLLDKASIRVSSEGPTTILVGPNNSGKTSVAEGLLLFVGDGEKAFTAHDFAIACRKDFEAAEKAIAEGREDAKIPTMSLDLHFEYGDDPADLAVAADLMMDLDADAKQVVMRVEFAPDDSARLISDYIAERTKTPGLFKFLTENLKDYYKLTYAKVSIDGNEKEALADKSLIRRLLKVDFVFAQRHIDDKEDSRATRLSQLLHAHYQKHYKDAEPDKHEAIETALKEQSDSLGTRYMEAFGGLIANLQGFGYSQRRAPAMSIRAELNADTLFRDNTRIYYGAHPEGPVPAGKAGVMKKGEKTKEPAIELPEKYNGLGYKNLIFMILQLQSFRVALERMAADRPRIHLIFIEEPETHLHPQMQSVFIRQIASFLNKKGEGKDIQFVLTTHSSHIVSDSGFTPIRYFKRKGNRVEVKDLLEFETTEPAKDNLKFLSKYMSLTRCDLFFADKAILIEGQVERLLLPKMLVDCANAKRPEFASEYVSAIEVGGAHAHKFKALLKFIEIPTLIITDLDSVGEDGEAAPVAKGTKTSNATLKGWLPKKETLADLKRADGASKTDGVVHVAYQVQDDGSLPCGRTFEEAFIYANAQWLIANHAVLTATGRLFKNKDSKAVIGEAATKPISKVNFALDLLYADGWKTPKYIRDGLEWLAAWEA